MLGFLKSFSSNIHYNYSVQTRPTFETGCWSVYDAKHKTSGDLVSVFVLSKKKIAEQVNSSGLRPRTATTNEILDFVTKGVQQLTKIRHPAVLRVVEPLESGKGSILFATERVSSTLEQLSDHDELSIVRGLTTVVQALDFVGTQLGAVHHNVTPHSVFVDAQGDWKLGAFEFFAKVDAPQHDFQLPILDPRMPQFVHPPLEYLAPELVIDRIAAPSNDVWGIACLIYVLYIRKPPMRVHNNVSAYKDELKKLRSAVQSQTTVSKLPQSLHPVLQSLFCEEMNGRISLQVLLSTPYFQNPLIKALRGMDEYSAKPIEEKVSFLKHFSQLLPQFPKQMQIRKVSRFAVRELLGPQDPATTALMANILFASSQDMSRLGFQEQVLPVFAKLVEYVPFQESLSSNLEVVAKCTNDKDFSKSVLPVLLDILKHHDAQHTQLQTQILGNAKVYADNLTVVKMEQQLFPACVDCFAATPARVVKIAATKCLAVLVERNVSKALVTERLVPALQAMKTRDPLVVEAVGELWRAVCLRLNSEQIFSLALPHMLDISLTKQLTVDQFKRFMATIREQIDQVSKEQVKLLVHNEPSTEDWLGEVENAPVVSVTAPQAAPPVVPVQAVPKQTLLKPAPAQSAFKPPTLAPQPSSPGKPPINKELPPPPGPKVSSFPTLQPTRPNETFVPLVPTKNDDFGDFIQSDSLI